MLRKNIVLFITCNLLLMASSCKSSSSSKSSTKMTNKTENKEVKDNYTLVISFYSIGGGTDGTHIRKFNEFVENYNPKPSPIITPWGREGEIDYCFTLNELSTKQKKDFVNQVRELLKDCKLVHINENAPCVHK